MRSFWRQHREDDIERLLRANRAEPRDEFIDSQLQLLGTQQQRARSPHRLGRRVLIATAATALALGAAAAAGATHVAGTSISNLVHVAQSGVNNTSNSSASSQNIGNVNSSGHSSAGDQQYTVELCHHTHSATNPWIDLFLSPQGAQWHLTHHPLDYLPGAPGNPATCPP